MRLEIVRRELVVALLIGAHFDDDDRASGEE
jgi:hypothetical protein